MQQTYLYQGGSMIEEPLEINITKEPQYEVEEAVNVGRILTGIAWGLAFEGLMLIIAAVVYVCLVRP